MGKIKCYDVLSGITDVETERIYPLFVEDPEAKAGLKEIGDMFDKLADDFDGISYDIEIEDVTGSIMVSFTCSTFPVQRTKEFCELARRSNGISFSKADTDDVVRMDFIFDGIWKRNI